MASGDGGRGIEWLDLIIVAMGAAAAAFALAGQADTAATFLLSFIGLGALRFVAGVRVRLLPLAMALAAVIALGAIRTIGDAVVWSPLAHFIGGLFVGLALLPTVDFHGDRLRPAVMLVALVLSVGIAWELGEVLADAVLGTNLSPSLADAALDLAADAAGGCAASALATAQRLRRASLPHR